MISMEPVLKRGYTAWDQGLLPADEYVERVAAVRAELEARGLAALVVVNYSLLGAMFEYANIAYLAGLQSGGLVVITATAGPAVISFGGGRELSFMIDQTWTRNVIPGKGRSFDVAAEFLQSHGVAGGAIGVTGLADMPAAAVERLRAALGSFEIVPFDDALLSLRTVKRPRELLAIRVAKHIADAAAAAAASVFAAGGDNTAALIEAERVGRFHKARDVRVLVNMNAVELRPFEGRLDGRHEPLMIWVAAQYHGYWAETTLTFPADPTAPAAACVSAMAAQVRAGAKVDDIASAGLAVLALEAADAALQYGLGATVGLTQNEGITILPDSDARIPDGCVLSLTAYAPLANTASIASRMLAVSGDRVTELTAIRVD